MAFPSDVQVKPYHRGEQGSTLGSLKSQQVLFSQVGPLVLSQRTQIDRKMDVRKCSGWQVYVCNLMQSCSYLKTIKLSLIKCKHKRAGQPNTSPEREQEGQTDSNHFPVGSQNMHLLRSVCTTYIQYRLLYYFLVNITSCSRNVAIEDYYVLVVRKMKNIFLLSHRITLTH